MKELWPREAWRGAALVAAAVLLGVATGRFAECLLLALLAYTAWLVLRLRRFARWLTDTTLAEPPSSDDLWGELYYRVYRIETQARKREQRLKELVRRYQTSAAALPDAVVVLRGHDVIEWMNDAAGRLLGLEARTDIGQRIDNLIRGPEFIAWLHAGAAVPALEIAAPRDPERRCVLRAVACGAHERLLIARDTTEQHRLEVMRSDFVANVSHELGTPLTVISGYLEGLAARLPDVRGARAALEEMQRQTERMKQLVEDLLQITRLEAAGGRAAEREVDVPALLESVRSAAEALSGARRHEITLACDATLGLRGSERDLYSAFLNLARNAVQYTDAGGRIELRWYADAQGPHLEVRDNGIGIAPRELPRLTERFYRVDAGRSRESGGTGLGLAIVKHVLRNHDAQLHIESTPGAGSAFRCDFPAPRAARLRPAAVMELS